MSNVSDRQHGLSAACYLLPPASSIGHVAVLCPKVRWPLAVLVPVAARPSALLRVSVGLRDRLAGCARTFVRGPDRGLRGLAGARGKNRRPWAVTGRATNDHPRIASTMLVRIHVLIFDVLDA